MPGKVRLDNLLVDRGLAPTLEKARAFILSGVVLIDEICADKAGLLVNPQASIRIRGGEKVHPYVSRGGLKLKGALDGFGINVRDVIAIDVGASTGGFTDCLLQEVAAKVYALDVGYGQLAWSLRQDRRVIVIERTNIRQFEGRGIICDPIGVAVIDVSFISLKLVIPAVKKLLSGQASLLALVKPQFEVEKGLVGENGVVKDPEQQQQVLHEISQVCIEQGFTVFGE
ncbi:MAG: TlyA family RNA methyltransferase, partial [Syntrophales bacterium]|nr:TlyA family RNA methyltransferase [Syntrophales bacterium]